MESSDSDDPPEVESKVYPNLGMLDYEKEIFLDVIHADGLVVAARGLSCNVIVQNLMKVYLDPANLIIVINASSFEEQYFISFLNSEHTHVAATTAQERESNYLKGGIHFVSTRILIVDLLKERVPISYITGIIVLHAHSVIESCQEAFALRLYRQNNKTGFIKAFSNNVESFTFGYGNVENVMKSLFVKELQIWPRFHISVTNCLKQFEPIVIELHIPMTDKMVRLQTCLLDLMNFTCREFKNKEKNIELHEITVENCLVKQFQKILQVQLECKWHQLKTTTKQLLQDLQVLRSLMVDMMYSDAVSFYAKMRQYRTAEYARKNLSWILLDSAETMFDLTKQRVFNDKQEFDPEFCPKWKFLLEILRVEIPAHIGEHQSKSSNTSQKILILCNSQRTCAQLQNVLKLGPEKYLFENALKEEIDLSKVSKQFSNFDVKAVSSYFKITGNSQANTTDETDNVRTRSKATSTISSKSDGKPSKGNVLLRNLCADSANIKLDENIEQAQNEDDLNKVLETDDNAFKEDINKSCYLLTYTQDLCGSDILKNSTQLYEDFDEMENMDMTRISEDKPMICIFSCRSIDGNMDLTKLLFQMQPHYIIMYENNISAVRQIETYEARLGRPSQERTKLFFLIHNGTVEEQSYLTNLRREKRAFDFIIETKKNMVVPEYQDGKSEGNYLLKKITAKSPQKSTRQAGGQEESEKPEVKPKIIVDMREFRSDLPGLIHMRGIHIEPVTIMVGDYILTPEICVERKSVSDLIGSLNSGRLYNQCIQMSRYYSKPMLLIEFDQNGPFNLQGHHLVSNDKAGIGTMQKLQLLTIHFPKLRIIWSPGPYATAQLFEELKHDKEQPDSKQAAILGTDADTVDIEYATDHYNTGIYDFLMKLPGINSKNIGRVMNCGGSLDQLIRMTKDELVELLGNQKDADMFWNIVHLIHKPVDNEIKSSSATNRKLRMKSRLGRNFKKT